MDLMEAIKTRRSIRRFKDQKVEEEVIEKLIDAARSAPSSQDCQPWEFIIIRNEVSKKKLAELKTEDNREHILTAPVTIVVCVGELPMDKSIGFVTFPHF